MTKKLFYLAILKFVLGVVMVGILIFLPAGTFDYWNAWLLMGILFIPMFLAGIVMMVKNSELLTYPVIIAKRIRNEETVLEKELNGYTEYKKKVKYKIIPFVW